MMGYDDETFKSDVERELASAREKFPDTDAVMVALTEEVGELAKALLDESWQRVWEEAVQVAAMAQRVATEGDPTLLDVRRQRVTPGAALGPKCPYAGCPDPNKMQPPCPLCYE